MSRECELIFKLFRSRSLYFGWFWISAASMRNAVVAAVEYCLVSATDDVFRSRKSNKMLTIVFCNIRGVDQELKAEYYLVWILVVIWKWESRRQCPPPLPRNWVLSVWIIVVIWKGELRRQYPSSLLKNMDVSTLTPLEKSMYSKHIQKTCSCHFDGKVCFSLYSLPNFCQVTSVVRILNDNFWLTIVKTESVE